jgi:hypothetical protein
MARVVRQALPQPPPVYDQSYMAELINAVNAYMFQREAPGEVIAARFVMTDPPVVSAAAGDYPDTSKLATGTLYLAAPQTGQKFLTVVNKQDV